MWFTKVVPKKKLLVVSDSSYELDWIRGVSLHDFLLEGDTFDFIKEWALPQSAQL